MWRAIPADPRACSATIQNLKRLIGLANLVATHRWLVSESPVQLGKCVKLQAPSSKFQVPSSCFLFCIVFSHEVATAYSRAAEARGLVELDSQSHEVATAKERLHSDRHFVALL